MYHKNIVNWMQNLYFMRLREMYTTYNSILQALGPLHAVMYICECWRVWPKTTSKDWSVASLSGLCNSYQINLKPHFCACNLGRVLKNRFNTCCNFPFIVKPKTLSNTIKITLKLAIFILRTVFLSLKQQINAL